jgi:hypothetical protein
VDGDNLVGRILEQLPVDLLEVSRGRLRRGRRHLGDPQQLEELTVIQVDSVAILAVAEVQSEGYGDYPASLPGVFRQVAGAVGDDPDGHLEAAYSAEMTNW